MSDRLHQNVRAAIRQALLGLVKATGGPAATFSFAVTSPTTGVISRTAGSFYDDGFAAGDECVASGWATSGLNGTWFVQEFSDTTLTVRLPDGATRTLANEAAGAVVTLVAGLPSTQVDENIVATTTLGQPWFRESYKGGPEIRRTLATKFTGALPSQAQVRLDFLYMLSVFYPSGVGSLGPDGMADAVRAVLYPGRVLTYNGQSLTITRCSRQGGISEADWVSVPLSIRGFAYTITP
jgi:hypothetical protein